jgi:hypothetical protein
MKAGQSGVPGFDYVERIGMAWQRALTTHAEIANKYWDQIKAGKFDCATMMASWAKVAEAYFGPTVEAFRGPGFVREPVWLSFNYQRALNNALEDVVRLPQAQSDATTLLMTDFAPFYTQPALLSSKVYKSCDWADDDSSRTQIKIVLDHNELQKINVAPGQYISFVLAANRGPEAPLVIVMLLVT